MVKQASAEAQQPTLLKIGDKWVNVNAWKRVHPGTPPQRVRNVALRIIYLFFFCVFFFLFLIILCDDDDEMVVRAGG